LDATGRNARRPSDFRSARRNPWWIPPFLGGVPDVEPRLVSLLGLVSLALFFEQYNSSVLTSALKYIADDLGMAAPELGGFLAVIELGNVAAFLVVPFADLIGRRRVFLAAVTLCSLGTLATAFAQSAPQFVVVQMATRTFMLTASSVALVIVTEEFPARYRGWAIGMLGALAACGNGLGAALFAAIETLPHGWRTLYGIGLVPLLLLPLLRARVAETRRFDLHRAAAPDRELTGWYRPVIRLARTYPGRALGIAAAGGLTAVGSSAVFQFTGYFTLTVHQWSPVQFSLMFIVGGALGIVGNVVAGRLSDRVGRRAVGFAFLTLFPLGSWLFYHGPGWVLPFAWVAFLFCNTAGGVIVRAFSTELFPTSYRGTAAAWLSLVQALSWAGGLALVGLGTHDAGDIARTTSLLALAALGAAVTLLALPETFGRELEVISRSDRLAMAAPAADFPRAPRTTP
jgi:putative MFS transporter